MLYSSFIDNANSPLVPNTTLQEMEKIVKPTDVVNLQFTSGNELRPCSNSFAMLTDGLGTTGTPKAAMLTHL